VASSSAAPAEHVFKVGARDEGAHLATATSFCNPAYEEFPLPMVQRRPAVQDGVGRAGERVPPADARGKELAPVAPRGQLLGRGARDRANRRGRVDRRGHRVFSKRKEHCEAFSLKAARTWSLRRHPLNRSSWQHSGRPAASHGRPRSWHPCADGKLPSHAQGRGRPSGPRRQPRGGRARAVCWSGGRPPPIRCQDRPPIDSIDINRISCSE
jgi:hypothetical protein